MAILLKILNCFKIWRNHRPNCRQNTYSVCSYNFICRIKKLLCWFLSSIVISREIWVSALRDYNSRINNTNATKVLYISKVKTSIQLATIMFYLLGLALNINLIILIADIMLLISMIITVYTGYIYTAHTFSNKAHE